MGSEGRGSVSGSAATREPPKGKISHLIKDEKDWDELQAKDVPLGKIFSHFSELKV